MRSKYEMRLAVEWKKYEGSNICWKDALVRPVWISFFFFFFFLQGRSWIMSLCINMKSTVLNRFLRMLSYVQLALLGKNWPSFYINWHLFCWLQASIEKWELSLFYALYTWRLEWLWWQFCAAFSYEFLIIATCQTFMLI